MTRPVRIGVIGGGFGRQIHLPGFLAVKGAAVVGVASRTAEQGRQLAGEFSIPRAYATWQELVGEPDIDAVSIATPTACHEEMALAAVAAGKAVLCEKPLALNSLQAVRMLDAAQRARVVHMVDFEFREYPVWRFAKRLIEAGELGPIRHGHVTWLVQSWANPARPWSWRWDREQGGGTLGALAVHAFDYLEWLLNPVASLAVHLSTRIPQRPDRVGVLRTVTGEDCCNLLLELSDGTPISLAISSVAPFAKGHWIELYGERSVLVMGSDHQTDYGKGFRVWEGVRGSPALRELPVPADLAFEREFADGRTAPFVSLTQRFVDAVRDGRLDVRPSFSEGLRAQALLDAAVQAQQERRWLDVSMAGKELVAHHAR